jgi:2-dehydropantoate 2-reductase
MRYLVLGAGALGGYFGGRLLKGGADVTFLVRPARAAQLQRDGLVVKAQDGEIRLPARTVFKDAIDGPYDVVLLCCKAYDLAGAIDAIAPAMGASSVVLPMLNGMRHIAVLTDRFGAGRVLGGVTAINAALMPDGTIVQSLLRINITMFGELTGEPSARCAAIQQALAAGGLPATVSDDINGMMWWKFFGFTAIATIASLTRARAGAIARSGAGASFVSAVVAECARIAEAEGFPQKADTFNLLRGMFSQADSTYGPSLLVDIEGGRRTEGEHTIGDMVERATRRGLEAPILGAALCGLQAYEFTRQARQAQV